MPRRAPTTCKRPGCPGLVRNGVCNACGPLHVASQHTIDERRGTAAQRGYGGRWQRVRAMYLRNHPVCVACEREGRTTPATDVDHIVPRRRGGSDDESNLQALCHSCHSAKTGRGE